ncbi:zinc finger protein 414 [Puma concolor]|uniref:Zinc finger protein 414 n=1 Tax=Puma concolor TaxID=9696 RepID=A0A6P6H9H9_PUMCO|nr:zinc finger protein 414 [Puma concolor]
MCIPAFLQKMVWWVLSALNLQPPDPSGTCLDPEEGGSRHSLSRSRRSRRNKRLSRVEDGERDAGGSGATNQREEEPAGPSPDMPATAESSFSETDKEVLSPVAAAAAPPSSMGEDPGPDRAATPPVWDRGGPGGSQQGAPSAPDSGQPGPGSGLGPTSTVSGTSEDLRPPRRRQQPGKQIPCSSPGCCLSFPSVRDLAQHLRTHCPPTQSLEGKLFRCSALSCTETFPTMQELVAHGKLHYKPNRYFK